MGTVPGMTAADHTNRPSPAPGQPHRRQASGEFGGVEGAVLLLQREVEGLAYRRLQLAVEHSLGALHGRGRLHSNPLRKLEGRRE